MYPQESLALPTPFGALLVVGARGDSIISAAFVRRRQTAAPRTKHKLLRDAAKQVDAYFRKRLRRFDLPLFFDGTEFQERVWRFVSQLEVAEIVSYSDVARIVGAPRAHRAVAAAMRESPMDLFVPAHRVIGADGTVRGAGAYSMRRRLLEFEGVRLR